MRRLHLQRLAGGECQTGGCGIPVINAMMVGLRHRG
jgi:hypothetical protein